MYDFPRVFTFLGLFSFVIPLSGCSPFIESPPKIQRKSEAYTITETGNAVPSGLLELRKSDRLLAEEQEKCPVTGTILGTTGKPHKFKFQGREVFVDCKGSEPTFRSDPEYYLAKMQK